MVSGKGFSKPKGPILWCSVPAALLYGGYHKSAIGHFTASAEDAALAERPEPVVAGPQYQEDAMDNCQTVNISTH